MKHRAFTLWEVLIIFVILSVLAAVLWPSFHYSHGRLSMERRKCQSNLRHLGLAFRVYASDNDEKFPLRADKYGGWEELLAPYIQDSPVFTCPATADSTSTGYFLNARLSGAKRTRISAPSSVILSGDGAGWPSTYLTDLPTIWSNAPVSPAKRHFDGANYLFVDGHVKWLRPQKFVGAPDAATPTFEVK